MTTPTFASIDIGAPLLPGTTKQSGPAVEMTAGGKDIWDNRDEFHFAYVQVSGNFELSARLISLTMADVYTKAGLMLRASLDGGAAHAYFLAFGDNQPRNKNNGGHEFQYRETPDGPCTGIYPPQPLQFLPDFPVNFPLVWLRLSRDGDTISAQCSRDGEHWKTFCVHQQRLPRTAFVGLAVTAHSTSKTVDAIFSNLNLQDKP